MPTFLPPRLDRIKMKILLVQPSNRTYVVMPSLGLGYLAAVLRHAGHTVAIHNGLRDSLSADQLAAMIATYDYTVVGFQVFTYDLHIVQDYIATIRQRHPAVTLIAGGPHPSADPVGTLDYLPGLNFVIEGEAELGLPLLLTQLTLPSPDFTVVPGLVCRTEQGLLRNPPAFVKNLDTLPLPAWDLLEPENYPEAPHGAFSKNFPTAPIMISRGCPCQCTFCAGRSVSAGAYRVRSVANVMAELRLLKARGIREFHIEDENFTVNKPMVLSLCRAIVAERLEMSWGLPSGVRIDSLDAEMLAAMEGAGCYSLALGIEFGTQRLLDLTRKEMTLALVREKVALLKRFKMKLTGFFLFGIPGESFAEMEETLDFALALPLDRAQFNNFIPLPGSALWDELQRGGRLEQVRWQDFFVHGAAGAATVAEGRRLKRLQRRAYLKFYLRPHIIVGILWEIRSLRHLYYLLCRFRDALKS